MYVDARKTKGCTWTEEYPTKEIIKNDILRGDSFVIVNKKNNEIIAAISIDDDKLVEEQKCWSKELKPAGELARLVIAEEYRGNGLAGNLIQGAMENLQKRKYKGVHYLVSPNNANALRAYKKMEFNDCGRIFCMTMNGYAMKGEYKRYKYNKKCRKGAIKKNNIKK